MISQTRTAYRIGEVAVSTGLSPQTVARLLTSGQLKSFTVGRVRLISAEELARFIRDREGGDN